MARTTGPGGTGDPGGRGSEGKGIERRDREAREIQEKQRWLEKSAKDFLARTDEMLREGELVKQAHQAEIFGAGAQELRPWVAVHWKDRDLLVLGHRLPRAGEGKSFALWTTRPDGKPRLVGLFRPDASGELHSLQTLSEPLPPETVFSMTEEPSTGATQPTGTVILKAD